MFIDPTTAAHLEWFITRFGIMFSLTLIATNIYLKWKMRDDE